MTGTGLLMANETSFEFAGDPVRGWLTTLTLAVPELAMSEAEIWAVTCVLLTNVVGRAEPFHCTVAVMRSPPNPLPFTVRVNCGPPAAAEFGERLEMTGAA